MQLFYEFQILEQVVVDLRVAALAAQNVDVPLIQEGLVAERVHAIEPNAVVHGGPVAPVENEALVQEVFLQTVPALATGDIIARAQQIKAAEAAFAVDPTLGGLPQLATPVLQAAYQQQLTQAKPAANEVTVAKKSRNRK